MLKKILLMLIAISCLLLPLAGCVRDGGEETTTAAPELEQPADGYYLNTLPKDAYKHKDITIMTIDTNMVLEEQPEDADVVDIEKYNRDYKLREYFGMTFKYIQIVNETDDTKEAAVMMNEVKTGLNKVDLFIQQPDSLMTLAINGLSQDLAAIDTLPLENTWWDQTLNENISFDGKQYIAAGPVSEWYYGAVLALAYNKQMAANFGINNLYEIIDSGNWTLEEMQRICTDYDITDYERNPMGNDTRQNGTYMIAYTGGVGPYGPFASAGGKFATVKNDKIEIDLADDTSIDLLERINDAFDVKKTYFGPVDPSAKMFTTNRSFFWYSTIGWMEGYLPGSDIDYGIIPVPKYDTQQKEYISCAWPSSSFAVAIPSTVVGDRLEWVGMVLDAYCFLGEDMIKPVKYDAVVKYGLSRDEQTSRLLDLIFGNIYYDINLICNFGGSLDLIGTAIKEGVNGHVGRYMPAEPEIAAAIKDYVALIGK